MFTCYFSLNVWDLMFNWGCLIRNLMFNNQHIKNFFLCCIMRNLHKKPQYNMAASHFYPPLPPQFFLALPFASYFFQPFPIPINFRKANPPLWGKVCSNYENSRCIKFNNLDEIAIIINIYLCQLSQKTKPLYSNVSHFLYIDCLSLSKASSFCWNLIYILN